LGNQFEAAQFGQGVPETAFSGSVIVQHVMFLRLRKMSIDAIEVFAMALFRMVPYQNWLTERDHFKSFPGGEMSPGCNACVLSANWRKRAAFAARSDSKSFMP
jgi:hypothetical protein